MDAKREELKNKIFKFIHQCPGTDQADIHFELGIDFDLVCELCNELREEGLVEPDSGPLSVI
jgi:predicted transcriptional regulator